MFKLIIYLIRAKNAVFYLFIRRFSAKKKEIFVVNPPEDTSNGINDLDIIRYASKKTGGSTQNTNCKVKPKRRGWKVQDGHFVQAGHMVATQRTTRFHPGLNVGFGKNGTLFAMEAGKVVITCEKFDPEWSHTWVQRNYAGRQEQTIFKKYFNVIPEPQHTRFKLIDEV